MSRATQIGAHVLLFFLVFGYVVIKIAHPKQIKWNYFLTIDFLTTQYLYLSIYLYRMSATVDIGQMRKQLRNRKAILIGIVLQFVILPFVGFSIVKTLNMDAAVGVTLLVVTSSPGGSYSNCEFDCKTIQPYNILTGTFSLHANIFSEYSISLRYVP